MKNQAYYSAIHQLITAGHWITDSVSSQLKPHDISEPQYNVLRVLKAANNKPMAVEQISQQMVQRSSNVTRIIDKLVAKGMATRQECQTNRRKMDIGLTAQGSDFLEMLDREVAEFHKPLINKLNTEELVTLARLIQKLRK